MVAIKLYNMLRKISEFMQLSLILCCAERAPRAAYSRSVSDLTDLTLWINHIRFDLHSAPVSGQNQEIRAHASLLHTLIMVFLDALNQSMESIVPFWAEFPEERRQGEMAVRDPRRCVHCIHTKGESSVSLKISDIFSFSSACSHACIHAGSLAYMYDARRVAVQSLNSMSIVCCTT